MCGVSKADKNVTSPTQQANPWPAGCIFWVMSAIQQHLAVVVKCCVFCHNILSQCVSLNIGSDTSVDKYHGIQVTIPKFDYCNICSWIHMFNFCCYMLHILSQHTYICVAPKHGDQTNKLSDSNLCINNCNTCLWANLALYICQNESEAP